MQDILEILAKLAFELIIEIILKGPGYVILKLVRPREKFDADGCAVTLIGFLFWVVVGLILWVVIEKWN